MFSIYILKDPRYFQPRYVGQTSNINIRYRTHLDNSHLRGNSYKEKWIKSLLKENIKPEIVVIEEKENEKEAKEREIYWISRLKNIGYKITNGTNGGDGVSGHIVTEETRLKMSIASKGKPKSESHKQKCRIAALGKPAWNKGVKLSQEHCENLSKSHIGKDNHQSVLTREQVLEIRKIYKPRDRHGFSSESLAKKYGVSPSTIIHAIKGISWSKI